MEFTKVLETRRSIRKYDGSKKLTNEQIEELITAANLAPTWKNSQTGRFHVIVSEDMKLKFREECFAPYNAGNTEGAAAIIVATFVANRAGFDTEGNPDNELGNGWGIYDLGLQTENLLLKATDMGLGTLVMGLRDAEKIRALLNIPEEETIVSVVSVGYLQEGLEPKMPPRKGTAVSKIY